MTLRKRHILLILGFIFVPIMFILTNPDTNIINLPPAYAEVLNYFVYLMRAFLVFGLFHVIRKTMMDYPSADFGKLLEKATEQGNSGAAAIAMAINMLGYAILLAAIILPASV